MFKKLRNKLILINLGITSVVILLSFTMIYVVSTRTAENRPLNLDGPTEEIDFDNDSDETVPNNRNNSDDWKKVVVFMVREEKRTAAEQLLITLIIAGVTIEVIVALVSYFLAEEAVKPVKEAYESQKIFIANASHEIKTPLAAISANLEAADLSDNKWIHNVEIETAKLSSLNAELLSLARTDLTTAGAVEEVDLGALTRKILDSFEPRLSGKKLTRKIKVNKKVRVNAADFEQILSILMDNAVKYSESKIIVELNERNLTVSNDGKKIAAEKLPHIFDRFYQADKSSEGVGLGLSIAKSLAERNHWKLTAKSKNLTTFILTF